jgi:hypothetical protein
LKETLAGAADNWGGFYVGLDAGGGSSHECMSLTSHNGIVIVLTSEGCHDAMDGLPGGGARKEIHWHARIQSFSGRPIPAGFDAKHPVGGLPAIGDLTAHLYEVAGSIE